MKNKVFLVGIIVFITVIGFLSTGCDGINTIPVTGVKLDKTEHSLAIGGTVQLIAAVSPTNATVTAVSWESDNEDAATVAGGLVTAVAEGTAKITVRTIDGNFKAECVIIVESGDPNDPDDPDDTTDLDGDGTINNPYQISNFGKLLLVGKGTGEFAGCTLAAHYILTNNIILPAGRSWIPIGLDENFTGTFDGNNKTISGITFDTFYENMGMFAVIGDGGIVKNLKITNVNIDIDTDDLDYDDYEDDDILGFGIIAGFNAGGSILNCSVVSDINIAGLNYFGGITGVNTGTMKDCFFEGDIIGGRWRIGGIIGENEGTIENCFSTGKITAIGHTGGVVGFNTEEGIVLNCYSASDIKGTGWGVGGIAGGNDGTIENCYFTGDANSNDGVGGIVGEHSGIIESCYVVGNIVGTGWATGGVAGNNDGVVKKCYFSGNVTGKDAVGGLVGNNDLGIVENCYSEGIVYSVSGWATGGVAGNNAKGIIDKCYTESEVIGLWAVGGVVGNNDKDGKVLHSLALNLKIAGSNIGHIVGTSEGELSGNYADPEESQGSTPSGKGPSHVNGDNIPLKASDDPQGFLETTMGWDFDIWDIENGFLKLKGVGP